jgi:PD-(D/E)XK nuclease superfamily
MIGEELPFRIPRSDLCNFTMGLKRFLTAKARRPRRREEMKKTRKEIEPIAEFAVDAMLKVHRALGPGLLESAYQACLALRALRAFAVNLASYREIRG